MKTKILLIKIVFISIIALITWWGVWGHSFTSEDSDYWFKENSQQCAPAYPIVALLLIVGFWGSVIFMQGGLKWYGSEASKWVCIGLATVVFTLISVLILTVP